MGYIWTVEWAIGHPTIDMQHKQLFEAINSLLDACANGQGCSVIDKTIAFLMDYVDIHFKDEEKLQEECGYPDLAMHAMLHERFRRMATELEGRLRDEGPTVSLVAKVNSCVGDWLVTHIQQEDKKVADYIKTMTS